MTLLAKGVEWQPKLLTTVRSPLAFNVAYSANTVHEILGRACDAVRSCVCESGCVACEWSSARHAFSQKWISRLIGVQSPACKEGNVVCPKIGALLVLQTILGLKIDLSSIPLQSGWAEWETIVEASPVRAVGVQVELEMS